MTSSVSGVSLKNHRPYLTRALPLLMTARAESRNKRQDSIVLSQSVAFLRPSVDEFCATWI